VLKVKVYGYVDGAAVCDDETGKTYARFYDLESAAFPARDMAYRYKEFLLTKEKWESPKAASLFSRILAVLTKK
jgi:hypothetical protein